MASSDPFQDGQTLVFKTHYAHGTKLYLNSSPVASKAASVYMDNEIDFPHHPGCHWICKKEPDGTYRFKSWSTSATDRYLDSSSKASLDESVYIGSEHAGRGSYWVPSLQSNGTYMLTSQTPSGKKNVLTCNPPATGLEQPLHKWSGIFTREVHAKTGVYLRKF